MVGVELCESDPAESNGLLGHRQGVRVVGLDAGGRQTIRIRLVVEGRILHRERELLTSVSEGAEQTVGEGPEPPAYVTGLSAGTALAGVATGSGRAFPAL
jgi:hypothetical protein